VVKVGGPLAILTIGGASLAFWGPAALGSLGGGLPTPTSGGTYTPSYGPPTAPTPDVTVVSTTLWNWTGTAFDGDGDATHDSTRFQVLTTGSVVLIDSIWGATVDSAVGTTALSAGVEYVARLAYKANPNKGGWSAYDSVTVVNTVGIYVAALQWDTVGGPGATWFQLLDSTNTQPLTWRNGNGRASAVVTAASLGLSGWPTTNALRSTVDDPTGATEHYGISMADSVIPLPATGESLYFRWYFASLDTLDSFSTDPNFHGIQDGTDDDCSATSCINWSFRTSIDATTSWDADFRIGGPNGLMNGPELLHRTTYRFELQAKVLSSTTWEAHIRVYDAAGTLIHDDADFTCAGDSQCGGAGVTLADNPVLTCNTASAPGLGCLSLTGVQVGHNGYAGTPIGADTPFGAEGALCIRTDDWCGVYNAAVEAGGP